MFAFYKTKSGHIIKAFSHNGDWQLNAGSVERWFSKWSFSPRASLEAALERFLNDHYDEPFVSTNLCLS